MQGLERQPLVVLRRDVQTASVVRVDTNMYVLPPVFGAVHGGAMHEPQRAVRTHAQNDSPNTRSFDLCRSRSQILEVSSNDALNLALSRRLVVLASSAAMI